MNLPKFGGRRFAKQLAAFDTRMRGLRCRRKKSSETRGGVMRYCNNGIILSGVFHLCNITVFIYLSQIGPGEGLLAPRSGCALVLWCFALLFDRSLQTSANIAMLLVSFGITVSVTVKNLRIEHLPMLLEFGHPSRTFGTDFSQSLRNVNLPRSLALGWDNDFRSCEVFTDPIYVVVKSFGKRSDM